MQLSEQDRKVLFALKRNMCLNPTAKLYLFDCYIGGVVNLGDTLRSKY